jgi:hypothetical protein|tara:strand:- start:3451 stop:3747 length:297 start_codon:yes stop_codon:yes gene_type:complete
MKKIVLLLITIFFCNLSYAAFPAQNINDLNFTQQQKTKNIKHKSFNYFTNNYKLDSEYTKLINNPTFNMWSHLLWTFFVLLIFLLIVLASLALRSYLV